MFCFFFSDLYEHCLIDCNENKKGCFVCWHRWLIEWNQDQRNVTRVELFFRGSGISMDYCKDFGQKPWRLEENKNKNYFFTSQYIILQGLHLYIHHLIRSHSGCGNVLLQKISQLPSQERFFGVEHPTLLTNSSFASFIPLTQVKEGKG